MGKFRKGDLIIKKFGLVPDPGRYRGEIFAVNDTVNDASYTIYWDLEPAEIGKGRFCRYLIHDADLVFERHNPFDLEGALSNF